MANAAKENDWPTDVKVGLIGSCTNSSYEDGVIIGAKSVIGSGCTIGNNSVVCMGAVVTKDIPPETVVMGHPAKAVYSRSEYEKKKYTWEKKLK